MTDQLPPLEIVGGEGRAEVIRFDDFAAVWSQELWNRGWVSRVWHAMINKADWLGLELVDDPDPHPASCRKAITTASFLAAPIRYWVSPAGSNKYAGTTTGIGKVSIKRLLEYRETLK